MSKPDIELSAAIDAGDWGVTGDGVTDDSAAAQRAIDHLAALGGGVLRFADGSYQMSVTLPKGACVILAGVIDSPGQTA